MDMLYLFFLNANDRHAGHVIVCVDRWSILSDVMACEQIAVVCNVVSLDISYCLSLTPNVLYIMQCDLYLQNWRYYNVWHFNFKFTCDEMLLLHCKKYRGEGRRWSHDITECSHHHHSLWSSLRHVLLTSPLKSLCSCIINLSGPKWDGTLMSASKSRCQVFLRQPLFIFLRGFQVRACFWCWMLACGKCHPAMYSIFALVLYWQAVISYTALILHCWICPNNELEELSWGRWWWRFPHCWFYPHITAWLVLFKLGARSPQAATNVRMS